jgi:hypothetical protein
VEVSVTQPEIASLVVKLPEADEKSFPL